MGLCAGLDWYLFGKEGWVAGVGWDEGVWVWDVGSIMGSRQGSPWRIETGLEFIVIKFCLIIIILYHKLP